MQLEIIQRLDCFRRDIAIEIGPLGTILKRKLLTNSEVHPFRKGL